MNGTEITARSVAVIGAGIVGVSCAVQLQKRGLRVTLVDSVEPGRSTSFGNAGGIAVGSVVPLSVPGTLAQVPGWLIDPLGPLAIRWSYLPKLAPWLWRFWRAGSPAKVERAAAALAALLEPTYDDYVPLLTETGLIDLLRRDGCLSLYETESAYQADRFYWDLKRAHGVKLELVRREELRQMEPDIAPNYELAVFQPDWGRVLDPFKIVDGLARWFARNGGTIKRVRVNGAAIGEDGAVSLATDAGPMSAEALVIAAGAWSHEIARWFGSAVPLETERGYHLTLPNPGPSPKRSISMGGWVMTPMEMGLRLAGTVELAGLKAPPDWRRARVLGERAKTVLPGLNVEGATEWMGHRPSLPDSLPVISRSPHHRNVFYAFGASHLGLTEGATTGRLIADLVTGQKPAIDLAPFRIDRF